MNRVESYSERLLDSVLDKPNASAQLDRVKSAYPSDDIVDAGFRGGAIDSVGLGQRIGRSGSSEFNPGLHSQLDILEVNTEDGQEQIIARNPRSSSAPLKAHVLLDVPETRVDNLTGDYRYERVANFMLAISRHVATTFGGELAVYKNEGDKAGLLFEGLPEHGYLAESVKARYLHETEPSLGGLLSYVNRRADFRNHVVILATDFQDDFDIQSETFDWEKELDSLNRQIGDRLWTTRITTPAHYVLPYGAVEGLDEITVDGMNEKYKPIAKAKEAKIQKITKNLPHTIGVDLIRERNDTHPVLKMEKYIFGT